MQNDSNCLTNQQKARNIRRHERHNGEDKRLKYAKERMMLSADAPFVKAAKCRGFTRIVADVHDVHAAASVNPFTSSAFASADLNLPLGWYACKPLLITHGQEDQLVGDFAFGNCMPCRALCNSGESGHEIVFSFQRPVIGSVIKGNRTEEV